jgi:hypothetical protein
MRTFIALVIAAGLGLFFYHQKHLEAVSGEAKAATAAGTTRSAVANGNAQPRPVSEHNWMKRSVDRATDVRDQARAQTQQSQNP